MELHGKHLIAGQASAAGSRTFTAINPSTGQPLPTPFHEGTEADVDGAMVAAAAAFESYRGRTGEEIARLLHTVASEVEGLGETLVAQAHAETGLPLTRLQGERGRLLHQVRVFAELAREGSWVSARIDRGEPQRTPQPKPDVRCLLQGVGPVVMFGASNFPLAISVAGTDTVSALATGCPVVVKAHPAHPGTSELVGRALTSAIAKTGMPAGIFSMIHGAGVEVGQALVRHPQARAVAFTGSLRGGRALFDTAAARPDPIPVFAEMGSTNPVILLPGALRERGAAIGTAFVQSVTMGVGQFCTSPGMVFALAGPGLAEFEESASGAARTFPPATMLHPGIRQAFQAGLQRISGTPGVSELARSSAPALTEQTQAPCVLFTTDASNLSAHPDLADENFGPSSLVVRCPTRSDLERLVRGLQGHLTASVHGTPADLADFADLIALLATKVGRLIFNGFGTGIEVCAAMNHAGPYPASTYSQFTSIGHAAFLRFVRPVAYQGFPDHALPEPLRNHNARGIWRLIDDHLTTADA